MTNTEIQQHIDAAIRKNFTDFESQSGEMMTSEEGDGRFFGKVSATRYSGLPPTGKDLFLAIGETKKKLQIVKLGRSECVTPSKDDLDFIIKKELGIA